MSNGQPSRVSRVAGIVLIATGVLVFAGWAFEVERLKALTGQITMKTNTALGLAAAGVSVLLLGSRGSLRKIGIGCALFIGLIGSLTLSEHLVGWNLGIDELVFGEAPGALATTSPNRMGPNAATSLTLACLSLLCLYRGSPRSTTAAQLLAACMGVLALIPVVGYFYGAQELYTIARYTGISPPTGAALLVLSAGLLGGRPHEGPIASVTTSLPHGVMARRLLVGALLVPPMLGYVRVTGERVGWYDSGLGTAIVVVAVMVMFSMSIWRSAIASEGMTLELRSAQQEREKLLLRERAARERAERADRAKDEFIAALSHELRTPLNAVLGWMFILQHEAMSAADRTKATDAVIRNAAVLARLIEDLLDTSRITTGHLILEQVALDTRTVVQAAVESVMPAAVARGVEVEFLPGPPVPPIVGDPQRLQQVVWNLLSNGIKFSPPDRKVTVSVSEEEEAVLVVVQDEGEGIDEALLPHLFDRLRQGDASTTRAQGGLGLGLFIARHLTLLHGGTLQAQSDGPDKGATFTVRLPLAPPGDQGGDASDGERAQRTATVA